MECPAVMQLFRSLLFFGLKSGAFPQVCDLAAAAQIGAGKPSSYSVGLEAPFQNVVKLVCSLLVYPVSAQIQHRSKLNHTLPSVHAFTLCIKLTNTSMFSLKSPIPF